MVRSLHIISFLPAIAWKANKKVWKYVFQTFLLPRRCQTLFNLCYKHLGLQIKQAR